MNKYYFDFIKERLKKDILHEFIQEGVDKQLIEKEINLYFQENDVELNEIEIKVSSDTHKIRPRSIYQNRTKRCKARIWNEGEGGQCSCSGLEEYAGFCKTHFKKGGNDWWLGVINQPRPERPIKPDGTLLTWNNLTPSA